MLAACVLIFTCFLFALCYRKSLINRSVKGGESELLIYKNESVFETPRTDIKRQEMAEKYEKLRDKWGKN